MAELNNEQLNEVNGGKSGVFYQIELTGPYWDSSVMTKGPFTFLIGKPDLLVEEVLNAPGPCKYRISRYGEYMGWTIRDNFRYK